jgi:hypothetical protein
MASVSDCQCQWWHHLGRGIGGYVFGKLLLQLHHALAPIVFAIALAAFFGCGHLVRRYEDRLTELAERALPGSLAAAVAEKGP